MPAARPGSGQGSPRERAEDRGGRWGRAELALCRRTRPGPWTLASGMVVRCGGRQGRRAQRCNYRWEASYPYPCSREGRARPRPCPRHLQSSVQFFPLPPGQHARVFHRGIVIRSNPPLTLVCLPFEDPYTCLPFIISVLLWWEVFRLLELPSHAQQFTTCPVLRRRSLQQSDTRVCALTCSESASD